LVLRLGALLLAGARSLLLLVGRLSLCPLPVFVRVCVVVYMYVFVRVRACGRACVCVCVRVRLCVGVCMYTLFFCMKIALRGGKGTKFHVQASQQEE